MDNGKNNAGSILITVGKERHKEKQRWKNTEKNIVQKERKKHPEFEHNEKREKKRLERKKHTHTHQATWIESTASMLKTMGKGTNSARGALKVTKNENGKVFV